jgi:hypothetical protein
MSNRRKIQAQEAAEALGRIRRGVPQPGDYRAIEDSMDGDLALLCHCLKDGQATTIVIGVKSWEHAGACIGLPFFADDTTLTRKLFEIVPLHDAPNVRNPLSTDDA